MGIKYKCSFEFNGLIGDYLLLMINKTDLTSIDVGMMTICIHRKICMCIHIYISWGCVCVCVCMIICDKMRVPGLII